MQTKRKKGIIIGLGVMAAAGIAGSALAAGITTTPTNAGQGTSVTNGYNATNVAFETNIEPNDTEAAAITAIKFNLYLGEGTSNVVPTTGHTVFARLNSANWASCTVAGQGAVTCALTGEQSLAPSAVDSVEILAYKN